MVILRKRIRNKHNIFTVLPFKVQGLCLVLVIGAMADANREQVLSETQNTEDKPPPESKEDKNGSEDAELNELLDSMYYVFLFLYALWIFECRFRVFSKSLKVVCCFLIKNDKCQD